MEIVINHLTRMQKGYMCAAGVELRTRKHVRPSVRKGRLTTSHLSVNGGPFDIGNRVDIGAVTPLKRRPQVEDCSYNPGAAVTRGIVHPVEFWQLLDDMCKPTLTDIFGPELRRVRRGCATDEGRGRASLGCIRPKRKPNIYLRERTDRRPQIRISFTNGQFDVDGSLTDIRLYQDDHVTPDRKAVQKLSDAMKQSHDIILCVGLTREWSPPDSDLPPVHWVQVNNVHLLETPVRQLATLEEDDVTDCSSEAPDVTDYSREARKRGLTFREYLKSLYE